MKINDDHMYHGAALIQIAEHPQFTAINTFKLGRGTSRSAFQINNDIGVYLKYAGEPKGSFSEYAFTFSLENLRELEKISKKVNNNVYLALVCVKNRQICCLPYERLVELIHLRYESRKAKEKQYVVLVTVLDGKSFRVYMNNPNKHKHMLGQSVVRRSDFPRKLFR